MTVRGGLVRLQIPSLFDMVDLVQVLSDRMGQLAAFDEDAIHWVGVAVRESVINAIKHGNREHPDKTVTIEFAFTPSTRRRNSWSASPTRAKGSRPRKSPIRSRPRTSSSRAAAASSSCAASWTTSSCIAAPEGGMEVRMVKKLAAGG